MKDLFPCRSMLYVPGNNPSRLQKCGRYGADAVILDLEDSVPESKKEEARVLLKYALKEPMWGDVSGYDGQDFGVFVRINSLRTSYWKKDVEAVVCAQLSGIKIPKVEQRCELDEIDFVLSSLEEKRGLPVGSIGYILTIETAKGLLNLRMLCEKNPRLWGLGFGSEDFMTDTGMYRKNLWLIRSQITTIGKAFGLYVQDSVFPDFSNPEALEEEATQSKELGMDGKTAIHPDQIEIINRVFSPSQAQLLRAREIVDMAEAQHGRAFSFHGEMVDVPIVQRNRKILLRGAERQ